MKTWDVSATLTISALTQFQVDAPTRLEALVAARAELRKLTPDIRDAVALDVQVEHVELVERKETK